LGPRGYALQMGRAWRRAVPLRAAAITYFTLLSLLLGVAPSYAHAVLLGSEPPHRAALARAPHHVVLRFNERVTPIFARLVDAAGREQTLVTHAVDSDVHVLMPAGLGPGTYVVSFRVTSNDGHPVGGSLLFAIGAAPGDWKGAPSESESGVWRQATIVNRALHLLCLFLAAGGLLFAALVGRGTLRSPVQAGLAALAGVTALAGIVLHGATLADELGFGDATFWQVALATPQAASAGATLLGLALAFGLAPRLAARSGRAAAILGAAVALGAAGATGHSAAAGWMWSAVAAVHVVAAGFWFGSLPPLLTALRAASLADAAALLQRFSRVAVPGVVLLALAGGALALQRMHGLADLLVTDYGGLVLLKIAGAALLIAIAALNKFALTPALGRCAPGAARRLRLAIGAELMLMAGVVAIAATLAHTDPHSGHSPLAGAPAAGLTLRLEVGERIAAVALHPAKPGRNTLTVAFAKRDGTKLMPLEATLELALPGQIEGFSIKLSRLGDGKFAGDIAELAVPGRWQMRIDALITDFEKAIFRADIEVR
jgi:copper transport protein